MTKPKITRENAISLERNVTGANWNFIGVYLIAFRGYYQDNMGRPGVNDRGIYDDCICVVTRDEFYTFNANTDPSAFRQGIATLVPGIHIYKKGDHHIGKPNAYPAFRPATKGETLPVWRDGEVGRVYQGVAINIHRGGYNSTSSEGCQTLPPDQWAEFQPLVYGLMDRYKQTTIPYVLINWVQ